MLEKDYMKNLTKLKNKLQLQSKHPTFLEDENWASSQKSQKQSRTSYKIKHEIKNAKRFDLDQIKKELGLFQLKNSESQQTQYKIKVEKANITKGSSVKKKQKEQGKGKGEDKKSFNRKNNKVLIKQEVIAKDNKGGFTDRINQLVKLRVEHENIINSLVKQKSSKISAHEEFIPTPINKLQSHSSGYIKISNEHDHEALSPQKSDIQSDKFKKQKNPPPKLNIDSKYFGSTKNKKSSFHQDKDKVKQNKTNSIDMKDFSVKDDQVYRRTFTEKQLGNEIRELAQQRPTLTEPQTESKRQSMVGKASQLSSENNDEVRQNNEGNEPNFQMEQHINLLASLDQLEYTNRQNTVRQNEVSIENQLYLSILQLIQSSIQHNNQFSKKFKIKNPKIHIIYTGGMNQNHQEDSFLVKGIKRIKPINKDFEKVVCYLTEHQVWQGLFRSEEKSMLDETNRALIKIIEFYGLCFDSGNYTEILLSNTGLSQEEKRLLLFNFQEESTIYCDISLVLLSRLVNLQINKSFPEMLHRLCGYQFEVFSIEGLRDFMGCMDFIDRLREIHNKELKNKNGLTVENKGDGTFKRRYSLQQVSEEQQGDMENHFILQDSEKHCDFQLFGFNKTCRYFELITPSLFSQKNKIASPIQLYEFRELMKHEKYTKRLSQSYSKLTIINKKQLPVKSMKLKHFTNHFVVVSLNIYEQGLYFMSVGQKIDELTKIKDTNKLLKYRLCLISSASKTILQCLVLERNQSYPVYLEKQEFEIFISAYESETQSVPVLNQSQIKGKPFLSEQEILNFTFYIQSHHIIAKNIQKSVKRELEMELRLKEEYQIYTAMIMEQFIEFSFLEKEVIRFFSLIHQLDQSKFTQDTHSQSDLIKQENSYMKEKYHSKNGSHNQFEDLELKSQESYNFISNQHPKMKDNISSESRILRLSLANHNPLECQDILKNDDSLALEQATQKQFAIFQDLQIEHQVTVINILRVHLKAMDMYIDCIDTSFMRQTEAMSEGKQVGITVKYSQQRVLCDENHQKNSVNIRPSSINLIYLTKDSPISSIKSQHRKINNQHHFESQFNLKIFRKQW